MRSYAPLLPPYPHQAEALARMKGHRAFALFMFMRTGKTKVVLDDFGRLELEGELQDMLVIAPAGVYRTWEKAIRDHVSHELQSRLAVLTWISSKARTQEARLARAAFLALRNRPRIALVNVEALSTVKLARQFCIDFLRSAPTMLVIDESTVIKNKSIRTKFINSQLKWLATHRRILSGLPTPRSPMDFYHQLEFLDSNILKCPNVLLFQARYAITRRMRAPQGHMFDQIVGFKNLDRLKKLYEPFSFQVPFRPLIPSTFTIREVPLTTEQARIYAEMKTFATAQLAAMPATHVTATAVIAQVLRLHQILLGHVTDECGVLRTIPELRTQELLACLEEYSGKAVIWCSYDFNVRRVAEALTERYGEFSVARFWGGNAATREAEEAMFRTSPTTRFMVATQSAGGRGRTWEEADLVIYFSSTNNLEHRDQSEQRVQGLTKARQVDYIDLIAPDTVEPKILAALRAKMDLASQLVGDEWRNWVV